MEVVTIFDFLPQCGDVDDIFFWWFGEVCSTENTIEGDHGKSFASAACKPRQLPYLHPGSPLNQRMCKCTSTTRSTSVSSVQLNAVIWFLEEDEGEAESAKSEMMVASSVLCDLMPHCIVICDRRDRGVDFVLYTVLHASKHGRKRRDVAFFYSFNQSIRELRFHLFGFGNTIHNGSHDAKSYFHIWLHIVDALNRTTWFCSSVLSIQISIILI